MNAKRPLKLEYRLGQVFDWRRKKYYAVEAKWKNCCTYCAFHKPDTDYQAEACYELACEKRHRKDGMSVRFKEVK